MYSDIQVTTQGISFPYSDAKRSVCVIINTKRFNILNLEVSNSHLVWKRSCFEMSIKPHMFFANMAQVYSWVDFGHHSLRFLRVTYFV